MTSSQDTSMIIALDRAQVEAQITKAVREIMQVTFRRGGASYSMLERQAASWVEGHDFGPEIEAVAKNVVHATIRDAVTAAIKKQTGEALAQMIATGELHSMINAMAEAALAKHSRTAEE